MTTVLPTNPTIMKAREKRKKKSKYKVEKILEIDLGKSPQVELEMRGDQEGCIALDRWCAANFVPQSYLVIGEH